MANALRNRVEKLSSEVNAVDQLEIVVIQYGDTPLEISDNLKGLVTVKKCKRWRLLII